MASLTAKKGYSSLAYFLELELGTTTKKDANAYTGINAPITGASYTENGASVPFDPSSSQLMALSTQRYETELVLDACVTEDKCVIESGVTPYNPGASSTAQIGDQTVSLEFAEY